MATTDSPPDDSDDAPRSTDIQRWYDDESFDTTTSPHTDLDAVPDVADITYDDGTVYHGRSLSFLIERSMLDPAATVRPAEQ